MLVLLLGCSTPAPQADAARPNILVVDIDTWSAVIPTDPAEPPLMPNIDALAARGTRFTRAYSHSGWTLPALASLLTGSYPLPIEIADDQSSWRAPGTHDAGELLGLYGYTTAVFWGDTLPSHSALSANFQTVSSGKTGADVLEWLDTAPEPFFAYVHEIDLHDPDAMKGSGASLADPGHGYQGLYTSLVRDRGDEAARKATLARYRENLRRYDARVGAMVEALEDRRERTVILLTSDHGEDFFDHSVMDHGLLTDTVLHVPLVWVDPFRPGPATVDTVVQGSDITPSLLARAGIPADRQMDGQSLFPTEAYAERAVFSLSDGCHASLRGGGRKLIVRDGRPRPDRTWHPAGGDNGVRVSLTTFAAENGITAPLPDCSKGVMKRPGPGAPRRAGGATPDDLLLELYDLATDPGERTNLVAERPAEAKALLTPLLELLADGRAAQSGAPRERLDPAQLQKIREQGYWEFVAPGEE